MVAMLTHAKVVLIETTDGRDFVVESSANLRSCSSIEQITVTHDASEPARQEVGRSYPILDGRGDVDQGTLDALAAYCQAWSRWTARKHR